MMQRIENASDGLRQIQQVRRTRRLFQRGGAVDGAALQPGAQRRFRTDSQDRTAEARLFQRQPEGSADQAYTDDGNRIHCARLKWSGPPRTQSGATVASVLRTAPDAAIARHR